jgi:hypothetical protein
MEVLSWKKTKKNTDAGYMLRVSREEAIQLIMSLSSQLYYKNPNRGRIEFYTNKAEYFSAIVVEPTLDETNMQTQKFYETIEANAKHLNDYDRLD